MNKTNNLTINNNDFANFTLLLLLGFAYFPLFLHLDVLPLRMYDESRLAVNAMEMIDNGNILVTYFDGQPDMWNLKPPLMIWLQAICMKILGYNELAVRLPSALFGLLCVLFIYGLCTKFLKSSLLGFVVALVLLTSTGFVAIHVTRTGEYDAMLCFFMLAYALFFFKHLQQVSNKSIKNLYLCGVFISLAVLTKGIAGLLFLPGLVLYALYRKRTWQLLLSPHTYVVITFSIGFILAYYLGREHWNPGYLQAVWENEIGGRYNQVIETHQAPFKYYFNNLRFKDFATWVWWLPLSVAMVMLSKKNHYREVMIFSLLLAISFVMIISFAQTKLSWYVAPSLPFFAFIVGIGVHQVITYLLLAFDKFNYSLKWVLSFLLSLVFFGAPYSKIISEVYKPQDTEVDRRRMLYGPFLEKLENDDTYYITSAGYNSHISFYAKAHRKRGKEVKVVYPEGFVFPKGAKVMICEEAMKEMFQKQNKFKQIDQYKDCQLVEVIAR